MSRAPAALAGALVALAAACTTTRWTSAPSGEAIHGHGFSVRMPADWSVLSHPDAALASRDGPVLQQVTAGCLPVPPELSDALPPALASSERRAATQAAAVLALLREGQAWATVPSLALVAAGAGPATLDGRAAVQVEAADAEEDPTRAPMRARVVAARVDERLCFVGLAAARRLYFDDALPAWEAVRSSFRIGAAPVAGQDPR